jgi:hypothetical protein
MTESTQLKLNSLCEKMHQSGYQEFKINRVTKLISELQQRDVRGIDKFLKILSQRLSNEDEYFDILREGRFAGILARNGFKQIEIEYANEGPDVKTRYSKRTVYFEITRKRENEEDKAIHQSKDGVGWISPYRLEYILSTIQSKLKKLKDGELNIVVIWADTISLDIRDFKEAVKYIQQEIDISPGRYRRMSGILFTEGVSYPNGTPKQFHLFSNDKADARLPDGLANKLQSMTEEDPRTLKRGHENLAAAMRKHSH